MPLWVGWARPMLSNGVLTGRRNSKASASAVARLHVAVVCCGTRVEGRLAGCTL